ncbi:hypothetical protein V8F33_004385 [Rhypophila sp. PSN 637]
MAIVKRFWSRLNARSRASDQQPIQNHHIDKPVDGSINRPEKPVNGSVNEPEKAVDGSIDEPEERAVDGSIEKPEEKAVDGSIDKPEEKPVPEEKPMDGPVSETQFTLEVTVIPVRNNDTPTNTISKGLVRLSRAMGAMNSLPSMKKTPDETSTMASFIINALNIMATVPARDRPEYVYSYHVFGTRTGIATYFNILSIALKHELESWKREQIMDDIFSAFLYFGIIILRTPVPLSVYIAVAIGVEVKNASSQTSALTSETASIIAEEIIRDVTPNVANPENHAPEKLRTPRQTDIRPLVSIFTSDQLAGLARRVACHLKHGHTSHGPEDAARRFSYELLPLQLNERPQLCPCSEESKNFPICLCRAKPMSQSEYEKGCNWELLPTII